MTTIRSRALLAFVTLMSLAAAFTLATATPAIAATAAKPAPEFQQIEHWLNSPPLKLADLRGKVVLVDFWTYTCGNCLNQLPHVKDWHTKYKDRGLVVIGVHTPEFALEKSTPNLQQAIARLQISHPVAQDNEYATWRAFDNRYWPAIYLIDKQGRIVYSQVGEGRYDETQQKIEALLAEAP